jgi:hypothetical protein
MPRCAPLYERIRDMMAIMISITSFNGGTTYERNLYRLPFLFYMRNAAIAARGHLLSDCAADPLEPARYADDQG